MNRLFARIATALRQAVCTHYPIYDGLMATARGRCVVVRCTKCGKEAYGRSAWRAV